MRYPECTSRQSIAGYHEFITEGNNCICGCGTNKTKCKLCLETKNDLSQKHLIII